MKNTSRVLIFCLLGFLILGCAGPSDDQGGMKSDLDVGLHQGLTILDLQPDFSVTAAFVKGDDLIYLQAVRGFPTPAEYQKDPSFPKFEVDVRFTDAQGRILYVRRGGDLFVDPTWEDDLVYQDNLPSTKDNNRALFDLIAEASESLERELLARGGEPVVARLLPELAAIREFGRVAPATYAATEMKVTALVEKEGFLHPLAGGGGSEGPEDAFKYFNAGWYLVSLHHKDIAVGGMHSATRIHQLNANGSYSYYDFCNHGTCASAMSEKCRHITINKPAWTANTCLSPYKTYSDNGGHNCHDDSRVQMAAFVYGAQNNGWQYWCNGNDDDTDISVNIWGFEIDQSGSPDCNNSTNRGYNFPGMYWFSTSNTTSATQNTAQFTVALAAGATYTFSTCGAGSGDTYLRLKQNGVDVAINDDACGLLSTITFTPSTAGVYVLHAGCYSSGACNGTVYVNLVGSAAPPPPPPSATPLFWYSASDTSSATQNTTTYEAWLNAGQTLTLTTCNASTTDTYLRLKQNGIDVAVNDDACGLQSTIVYTIPASGFYVIHAGCFSSGYCDGTVSYILQ